jgi:hypothetical protein
MVSLGGGRRMNRGTSTFCFWTLALLLLAACSAPVANVPGNYELHEVPDITEVGPKAYMEWFKLHAVTEETEAYIDGYRTAALAAYESFSSLTEDIPQAKVQARKNRDSPGEPGLKEPHKVEEKIYRMILESRAAWKDGAGGERGGAFPQGAGVLEVRRAVFAADPAAEQALRDIAGLRVILPGLDDVSLVAGKVRDTHSHDTIRFKDFIGKDYRRDGYRSVHFVILFDGKPVEVQVRTEAQHRWAKWSHKFIYKGRFKRDAEVRQYSVAVSDRLHARELGDCPPPCALPRCPEALDEAGGCYLE